MTEDRVRGWMRDNPGESSRICSDLYPVRSGLIEGKDSVRYEPVQVTVPGGMVGLFLPVNPAPDSMHREVKQGNITAEATYTPGGWQVKCRADSLQLVLDSLYEIHLRVDTQLQENTAHVRALQGDSASLMQKLDKATSRVDTWRKWALYAAGGLLLLLALTFRNHILGLIKKLIA